MLLEVRGLKTYFHTRKGPVKAVDGISYSVAPGEISALVGESGCGKTVSALSLLRLIPEPPAEILEGEAWFEGKDLLRVPREEMRHIRGRKIAVVFQEPMSSLNPVLTIGRQLTEALVQHSMLDRKGAQTESVRLLDMVGITDADSRLGQYPHQFSGGMRQRVMMAMALSCSPSLIIADEPTTAVDVTIQAQLLEIIYSLTQRLQVAVLLITHNLGVVAKYAHKVNVMYAGRIVEQASAEEIYRNPKHPYTQALLRSVPRLDRDRQTKLVPIEGQPPDLLDRPPGCAFHPRCSCVLPQCRVVWPPLLTISDDHLVACPYGNGK
ncbi:MAG: ABC transporter ATP-binding protein [Dehalococcoidia bacterium]|jgi:oligopeptide/dipeptide ABC transporter ATP-binding protein|nr:ABC transporter ATP-binding protein [Dehalococcoidia bacterium]MDP6511078.1 ABC transporter ATP-binding protein [Dehalococcoidia bacterium]